MVMNVVGVTKYGKTQGNNEFKRHGNPHGVGCSWCNKVVHNTQGNECSGFNKVV